MVDRTGFEPAILIYVLGLLLVQAVFTAVLVFSLTCVQRICDFTRIWYTLQWATVLPFLFDKS